MTTRRRIDAEVTAVIVAYRSADDLAQLLPLLADERIEVIVLDNASPDSSADVAEKQEHVRLVRVGRNAGWSSSCNSGAALATSPVIAFVNPDARPSPDDLLRLSRLLRPDVTSVSPQFVGLDGEPQPFAFRFPTPLMGLFVFLNAGQRLDRWLGNHFVRQRTYEFGRKRPVFIDHPGAACFVVATDEFRSSGGFDESMWLFFSDTDWCVRQSRIGHRSLLAGDVLVTHEGGGSVSHLPSDTLRTAFQRDYLSYALKHYGALGRGLTRAGILVLSGLLPAFAAALRGDLAGAQNAIRRATTLTRRLPTELGA